MTLVCNLIVYSELHSRTVGQNVEVFENEKYTRKNVDGKNIKCKMSLVIKSHMLATRKVKLSLTQNLMIVYIHLLQGK